MDLLLPPNTIGTVAFAQCISVVPGMLFWFLMAVAGVGAFLKNFSRRAELKAVMLTSEAASVSVTICIPAYLPGEGFRLLDTIHHCLSKLEYGRGFQLIVAYNTPYPMEELEQALSKLDGIVTSNKHVVSVLKVAGSTSKAENVNAALKIATGTYFVIYDADHHPDPDSLMTLTACMALENKRAPCHCVMGSTYLRKPFSSLISLTTFAEFFGVYFAAIPTANYISGRAFFMGSNGLWLTQSLYEIGDFTVDALTEDIDISFRAHLKNFNIVFCPESRSSEEPQSSLTSLWHQRMRWLSGWSQAWSRYKTAIFKQGMEASFVYWIYFFVYGSALMVCYDVIVVQCGRFIIPMAHSALGMSYTAHHATGALLKLSTSFQSIYFCVILAQAIRFEGFRRIGRFVGIVFLPPLAVFTAAYHLVAVKRWSAGVYGKWVPTVRCGESESAETGALLLSVEARTTPECTTELQSFTPRVSSCSVQKQGRFLNARRKRRHPPATIFADSLFSGWSRV